MKAHISPKAAVSKATMQAMHEYVDQESVGLTRRLFKLTAIALNDLYGFGKKRNEQLDKRMEEMLLSTQKDEVFWQHIDQRISQMKLDLPPENYEVYDK